MALPSPAERIQSSQEYGFARIERLVAEKREAGEDVISLGIGDPVEPTFPHVVEAGQQAVADPANHQYPSNRGTEEFRSAVREFYSDRFGVDLDPGTEIVPVLGAKEGIFNINLAYLNSGDAALAADPGYPVYTSGPRLAGGHAVPMPLVPELGFVPDLKAIKPEDRIRSKLAYLNYPNNPTGAVAPEGFFEDVVEFAGQNNLLVVHDASYTETTYDGYRAPSFLETDGAKEVGVEFFSLSKGFNMTGWRCAALVGNAEAIGAYTKLKTNVDSGMFGTIQRAGAVALTDRVNSDVAVAEMNKIYARRRDLVVGALGKIGVDVEPPKATIYVWAPVPEGYDSAGFAEHVLEKAGVVVSAGPMFGPAGEGFFRISLTAPDERIEEAVERIGNIK